MRHYRGGIVASYFESCRVSTISSLCFSVLRIVLRDSAMLVAESEYLKGGPEVPYLCQSMRTVRRFESREKVRGENRQDRGRERSQAPLVRACASRRRKPDLLQAWKQGKSH